MQIEGEFTIKLSAYELIALRAALGSLSHEDQLSEGLTLGQIQATTAIYSTLGRLGELARSNAAAIAKMNKPIT